MKRIETILVRRFGAFWNKLKGGVRLFQCNENASSTCLHFRFKIGLLA